MTESQLQELFDRDDQGAAVPPPDGFVDTSLSLARRRARIRRGSRIAVAGVAVLAAAAVTGGLAATAGPTARPGRSHAAASRASAAPNSAQALLGRVSLAADEQTVTVRDDQFIYTDILSDYNTTGPTGGKPTHLSGHDQAWVSVDGSRPGRVTGPGKDKTVPVTGVPASLEAPNYHYLETLPTDPDKLLAALRADRGMYKQTVSPDDALWMSLDALINNSVVMPPKLTAAVYRTAAQVPGITLVDDVTDAAGRHGIGVTRTVAFDGSRTTWIFDPKTYQYLGERSVSSNDSMVTAVVGRGVVDQAGQLPR